MSFHAKDFAGSHCGCRYQQDYRPTLGRDGKKESGTLEVIKFYYDGAIRFEQHCYGEAATFVFGVWASGMDEDGTLHWVLPDRRKSYYDEAYLPKKLDRVSKTACREFETYYPCHKRPEQSFHRGLHCFANANFLHRQTSNSL